jgi:hypothetical protein
MAPKNDGSDTPTEPGWYPDPWSATGEGERYFDGKNWGTAERPLGRHSVVDMEPRRQARNARARHERFGNRRALVPALVLIVAVAVVWLVPQLTGSDGDKTAKTTPGSTTAPKYPPPGTEVASQPRGAPPPVTDGPGQYEPLLEQQGSDTTVAWDPCRPVHFVTNPAGAPADGVGLIRDALGRVSAATGLQFVDDGFTDEPPEKNREIFQPERYDPTRWAPVLFTWSDETAFADLAGFVAGEGGPTSVKAPSGNEVYVSGQVILDRNDLSATATPDRTNARAVVLHEVGHLVGLGHTADRTQLMFSETEFEVLDFADGDRRGLAQLGTQACFPDV